MANPLEQSILSAVKANSTIGDSFARIGTKDHPRGLVMTAYRNAQRAMAQALGESFPLPSVIEVMDGLTSNLQAGLRDELQDMYNFGQDEAARQLEFYGIEPPDNRANPYSSQVEAAVAACIAKANSQSSTIRALVLTGASPEQILGGETRVGILRPTDVTNTAAYWTAAMVGAGFEWLVAQQQTNTSFSKQVVAGLDNRTTDCCLRAHGQIKPLNKKFTLVGEPRFADELDWTPFHYYCRSSVALYLSEYDYGITQRMRNSASTILSERAAGLFIDRDPANAFG